MNEQENNWLRNMSRIRTFMDDIPEDAKKAFSKLIKRQKQQTNGAQDKNNHNE